jgi:hypothetical protein
MTSLVRCATRAAASLPSTTTLDLELLARLGHLEVVAPAQGLHVLPLHVGEVAEQGLQHRILGLHRRPAVEGLAAELDLEGLAHHVDGLREFGTPVAEHRELAAAVRAHAVGIGEALADLGATRAAPLHHGGDVVEVVAIGLLVVRQVALGAAGGFGQARRRHRARRPRLALQRHRRHEGVGVFLRDRPLGLAAAQVGADRPRGAAPCPHRQDHRRATGDDVAAGKDARHAGACVAARRRRCSPTC